MLYTRPGLRSIRVEKQEPAPGEIGVELCRFTLQILPETPSALASCFALPSESLQSCADPHAGCRGGCERKTPGYPISALTTDVYAENILRMIGLSKIIGFDWDDGNARKSQDRHGVNQAETEQVFFNVPLLLLLDEKHNDKEARCHAYGETDDGRKLHIAFTLRKDGVLIRVISARDMHRKERITYEKA